LQSLVSYLASLNRHAMYCSVSRMSEVHSFNVLRNLLNILLFCLFVATGVYDCVSSLQCRTTTYPLAVGTEIYVLQPQLEKKAEAVSRH
jgi:hypothetical protein